MAKRRENENVGDVGDVENVENVENVEKRRETSGNGREPRQAASAA